MSRRVLSGALFACVAVAATIALTRSSGTLDAHGFYHNDHADCHGLPNSPELRALLVSAAALTAPPLGGDVGGLFDGTRMWAAVVNRDGEVCAYNTSKSDKTQVWPGSQAIAKSKAYTANAFSLDTLPLSTALLYTFTQPGHSLWSLGQSNPFDATQLQPPAGPKSDIGDIVGGLIFFGGGVPLYKDGKIIGGLGVSGDTSCADHEIAKRVRHLAGLNPAGGPLADDIKYSSVDGATVFTHPLCLTTFRNGVSIGDEAPSSGY
jgi:uncharacterized protein GlcG (DUF336 family)